VDHLTLYYMCTHIPNMACLIRTWCLLRYPKGRIELECDETILLEKTFGPWKIKDYGWEYDIKMSRLDFSRVRITAKHSSCVSTVCPSVWNSSAPTGRIFIKFDIWVF